MDPKELEDLNLTDEERDLAEEMLKEEAEEEEHEEDEEPEAGEESEEEERPDELPEAEAADDEQSTVHQLGRVDTNILYQIEVPTDLDEQLQSLTDKRAELREQYQDGDLTHEEYEAQSDELTEKQVELRSLKTQADTINQLKKQAAVAEWHDTINSFLDDHPFYRKVPAAHQRMDVLVREMANDEQYADKPDAWFLEEAHRRVREEYASAGIDIDSASGKTGKTGKTGKKDARDLAPTTLANVPASEQADTGGTDRFDHLDGLEGIQLEAAIARMSPAELEAYEAME